MDPGVNLVLLRHRQLLIVLRDNKLYQLLFTTTICRQPGLPATFSLLAVHTNSPLQRSNQAEQVSLMRFANPGGAHRATRRLDSPLRALGF